MRKPRRPPGSAEAHPRDSRDPIVEHEQQGEMRLERRLRVPEALAFFDGHFPDFPVVPGTVQLGWAIQGLEALQGRTAQVRSVEALKFPALLRPGDVAVLKLEVSENGSRMHFDLEAPGETTRVFASGRCTLGKAP